jgi:hypothetical protein
MRYYFYFFPEPDDICTTYLGWSDYYNLALALIFHFFFCSIRFLLKKTYFHVSSKLAFYLLRNVKGTKFFIKKIYQNDVKLIH